MPPQAQLADDALFARPPDHRTPKVIFFSTISRTNVNLFFFVFEILDLDYGNKFVLNTSKKIF